MIPLTRVLAQQIVDRTMGIMDFNINVMNDRGVILASGDLSRVNSVHEGALLAISQKRSVAIDRASMNSLKGVRPGVNLPFYHQGEIIGVVGITGSPQDVEVCGQLLRVTAEMMVDQAHSFDQLHWRRRDREEFVLQVVNDDPLDTNRVQAWAGTLGIDVSGCLLAVVIELERPGIGYPMGDLRDIQHALETHRPGLLVARTTPTEIVVLVPTDAAQDVDAARRHLRSLARIIPPPHRDRVRLAVGQAFPGAAGIRRSCRTARETLRVGKHLEPERSSHAFDDLSLMVLLSGLSGDWRADELAAPFQALLAHDHRGDLVATVDALIAHYGDTNRIAEALFVHRNTVRYRLGRISEITGLDLGTLDGLLWLYVGSLLDRVAATEPSGGLATASSPP